MVDVALGDQDDQLQKGQFALPCCAHVHFGVRRLISKPGDCYLTERIRE